MSHTTTMIPFQRVHAYSELGMKLEQLKGSITSYSIVCAFNEIETLLSYLSACDTVPVQRNGRTTT